MSMETARGLLRDRSIQIVCGGMALLVVGTGLAQLVRGEFHYPVNEFRRGPTASGGDYHDFYVAALKYRQRFDAKTPLPEHRLPGIRRPLYNKRFNKPPLVVLLNVPLSHLDQRLALRIWQIAAAAAVLGIILLCSRQFRAHPAEAGLLCALTALSYPFAFLVDRGNLDSFSYGLSFLAFLALARGRLVPACAALALAAHFKPTVLLLLPALLLWPTRRDGVRCALLVAAFAGGLLALTPGLSLEFLGNLAQRVSMPLRLDENGSLARALAGFGVSSATASAAWLLLIGTFYAKLGWDHFAAGVRREPVRLFLLGLPFCQAVPELAYIYGYVFFPIAAYAYSGVWGRSRVASALVAAAATSIVVSQVPAVIWTRLWGHEELFHWLPSLGMTGMILCNTVWVWLPANSTLAPQLSSDPVGIT